jgi:hypothetical protein
MIRWARECDFLLLKKIDMNPATLLSEFQEAQQVLSDFSTSENMQKIAQGIAIMHTS